jgi:prepilin-type N-terminal cleavage/methylation domain-containing protein
MIRARHNHRGFTLIELMCAMFVGSLILLAAATVLGSSGEGYERVGGGVATEREARALISQLSSDLASARFHPDGVIERSSAAWPADRLGFLTLQPALAQSEHGRIGDLCTVHYYLKDLTIGGKTVRCLMRGFRESAETFKALENDNLDSLFRAHDDLDEPVAFGVVAFEARPMARLPDGSWTAWVPNTVKGPEAIEVKLVIARRELAGRLRSTADWHGGGSAGRELGSYDKVSENRYLESFGALIRYASHETL